MHDAYMSSAWKHTLLCGGSLSENICLPSFACMVWLFCRIAYNYIRGCFSVYTCPMSCIYYHKAKFVTKSGNTKLLFQILIRILILWRHFQFSLFRHYIEEKLFVVDIYGFYRGVTYHWGDCLVLNF